MTAQRSTTLNLAARHCAKAIDFFEAGTPRDRGIFATGIAAHAVLQAVHDHPEAPIGDVARAVVDHLCSVGRSFDGVPEPPMTPDQAFAGRDLAIAWLGEHGLPDNANAEYGVAVSADWDLCAYESDQAFYRCIFDLLWRERVSLEEGDAVGAVCRDYKSSWHASASDLDSVQMRGQAVLAAMQWGDLDYVRIEIANLRTLQIYGKTIWLDSDGVEMLSQWRYDIELTASVLAKHAGNRQPAPGAGCYGCPYLSRCDSARSYMRGTFIDDRDPTSLAIRYAVARSVVADLEAKLKQASDSETVRIPGGSVGWHVNDSRQAATDAHRRIAELWLKREPDDATSGMLACAGLGLGQIRRLIGGIIPARRDDPSYKQDREDLFNDLTSEIKTRRFEVRRDKG